MICIRVRANVISAGLEVIGRDRTKDHVQAEAGTVTIPLIRASDTAPRQSAIVSHGERRPRWAGARAGKVITGAFAKLIKLETDPPTDVTATLVADVDQEAQGCTVTVIGGERGAAYGLTVTFDNAAGRRWSRLLVILVLG